MNKLNHLNFFLMWIFGFFALLSFDLFIEGFVVVWFLYGSVTLHQRLKKK
ncbi:hypothetical protein N9797_01995 [Gammaproteobacteria bacterium]|nr:hypothetical protein [Gammaproteobacteria bacterium]MDB4178092.1 hypothetical protein [Gammaproteobacteria bacterium]